MGRALGWRGLSNIQRILLEKVLERADQRRISHSSIPSSGSVIGLRKRTAVPDALIVLRGMGTDDLRLLQLHAEVFFYEVDGFQDRQVRVPLAAARTADLADGAERLCRHFV